MGMRNLVTALGRGGVGYYSGLLIKSENRGSIFRDGLLSVVDTGILGSGKFKLTNITILS